MSTPEAVALNSALMPFGDWREVCLLQQDLTKTEEFRSESQLLFSSLVQSTQVEAEGVILTTKSFQNEAIAQLVQELGPALTLGTHISRIWALYCMCGAIEGSENAGLSHKVIHSLGSFLLGYCGPLEEDDDLNSDEGARDAAILCLTALVRTKLDCRESAEKENNILRMNLAKKGLQLRCATPELDAGMGYDHGYNITSTPASNDVRSGLSNLPRSRRSLCFGLIRACIDGVASSTSDTINFDITAELSSFTSFASTCLHGESDPRCLQELLEMMNVLQHSFLPYYTSVVVNVNFPIISVFDAVAPYYPIQFTPPPNDTHGITRKGLHLALMSVLSFDAFDTITDRRDTMLNSSAGIFLERMIPLDQGDSSVEDKKEAIEDFASLLFSFTTDGITKRCTQLHEDIIHELSVAMMSIHADAAANASLGGKKGRHNKALADTCRLFVSRVASDLECCKNEFLWNIFVSDVVKENSTILSTSPQTIEGRTTVAYLACLAASGGPKSLNMCLQHALPRLIDALEIGSGDEEKMAAAAYGLAAFYSSFRVCFERGRKAGVAFHPHPLRDFKPMKALIALSNESELNSSTRVAAIRAMDAVLVVTPLEFVSQSDFLLIHPFLDSLANAVTSLYKTPSEIEMLTAASRTLGSLISRCWEPLGDNDKLMSAALDNDETRRLVNEGIFLKILSHSANHAIKGELEMCQYALLTLALASEDSKEVANLVVRGLAGILVESLKDTSVSYQSKSAATFLSFILRRGGINTVSALHRANDHDTNSLRILHLLFPEQTRNQIPSTRALGRAMSTLELPSTEEERKAMSESVRSAYDIIPYLLPAFDSDLLAIPLPELADIVGHLLPPLSDSQNAQLCITLPFLSTALCHGNNSNLALENKLNALFSSLLEFALSSDNTDAARAAAASCLHSIVTRYQSNPYEDILTESWKSTIFLSLVSSIEAANTKTEALAETLSLVAMLGAAAACRGKASAKTADATLELLVILACSGHVNVPFSSKTLDLIAIENSVLGSKCQLKAGSAFGTMLAMKGHGKFWKQRLTHKARKLFEEQDKNTSFVQSTISSNSQGRLAVLCHIILASPTNSLKQLALESYAQELFSTLQLTFPKLNDTDFVQLEYDCDTLSLRLLHLTATLKFMACSPTAASRYIPLLVTVFLRVLSNYSTEDRTRELIIQFLALQGLVNATGFEASRKQLVAMKAAVVSTLSAYLDHPSVSLRQAVVTANNTWAVFK